MIQKNYSELFEFTATQLAALKRAYMPLKGKTLSMTQINKLQDMLGKLSKEQLVKLANTEDCIRKKYSTLFDYYNKRFRKWNPACRDYLWHNTRTYTSLDLRNLLNLMCNIQIC